MVADWVVASIAGVALVVSILSAWFAVRLFYRDQNPFLRGVTAKDDDHALIVKNVGRGPAISVVFADDTGRVLGDVDVVEMLQPAPKEMKARKCHPSVPLR